VANPVYKRVSTDQQSTARQNLVLRTAELEPAERAALDEGVTVRRGQGYTLRISAAPAVHHGLLARCQPLDGGQGTPAVLAQRKARREYENRVSALAPTGP
jgi:hypothetical protein